MSKRAEISRICLVKVHQGNLQGMKNKSMFGVDYYSFHKIPYAKPPVGNLRFKPPQQPDPWTGLRDATSVGPKFPSLDLMYNTYPSNCDEDSLFLNVYCKQNPNQLKIPARTPVIVFFHGGGFEYGSGTKHENGPDYFMLYDIVLVTFNYRLGALGFLSLQTPECPGNFGLKDQQMALQWVKKNIAFFGGDPGNVTLLGSGAGGVSVIYQTIHLANKGLFKRCITQSGSPLCPWSYSRCPRENAFALGRRLGCDTKKDKVLLDFLRKCPIEEIVLKSKGIIEETEGVAFGERTVNFTFVPTIEPEHEGAFFTKHPWISIKKGMYLDVPFMVGLCEREMLIAVKSKDDFPRINKVEDYQKLIPKDIQYSLENPISKALAEGIKSNYCPKGMTHDSYVDILSDTFFNYPVYKFVKSRATRPAYKSPTYLYLFCYSGFQNNLKVELGLLDIQEVSHSEDFGYMFLNGLSNLNKIRAGEDDYDFMKSFLRLLTNFATDGNPTPEKNKIDWPPFNSDHGNYLKIGRYLELKKGLLKARMNFWDDAYNSYYGR